jgi:hypothetical protein
MLGHTCSWYNVSFCVTYKDTYKLTVLQSTVQHSKTTVQLACTLCWSTQTLGKSLPASHPLQNWCARRCQDPTLHTQEVLLTSQSLEQGLMPPLLVPNHCQWHESMAWALGGQRFELATTLINLNPRGHSYYE